MKWKVRRAHKEEGVQKDGSMFPHLGLTSTWDLSMKDSPKQGTGGVYILLGSLTSGYSVRNRSSLREIQLGARKWERSRPQNGYQAFQSLFCGK